MSLPSSHLVLIRDSFSHCSCVRFWTGGPQSILADSIMFVYARCITYYMCAHLLLGKGMLVNNTSCVTSYSNWLSQVRLEVGPQPLCNRMFWWSFCVVALLCWLRVFFIGLNQISSLLSLINVILREVTRCVARIPRPVKRLSKIYISIFTLPVFSATMNIRNILAFFFPWRNIRDVWAGCSGDCSEYHPVVFLKTDIS